MPAQKEQKLLDANAKPADKTVASAVHAHLESIRTLLNEITGLDLGVIELFLCGSMFSNVRLETVKLQSAAGSYCSWPS